MPEITGKDFYVFHFTEPGHEDISKMKEIPYGREKNGPHLSFLTFD